MYAAEHSLVDTFDQADQVVSAIVEVVLSQWRNAGAKLSEIAFQAEFDINRSNSHEGFLKLLGALKNCDEMIACAAAENHLDRCLSALDFVRRPKPKTTLSRAFEEIVS